MPRISRLRRPQIRSQRQFLPLRPGKLLQKAAKSPQLPSQKSSQLSRLNCLCWALQVKRRPSAKMIISWLKWPKTKILTAKTAQKLLRRLFTERQITMLALCLARRNSDRTSNSQVWNAPISRPHSPSYSKRTAKATPRRASSSSWRVAPPSKTTQTQSLANPSVQATTTISLHHNKRSRNSRLTNSSTSPKACCRPAPSRSPSKSTTTPMASSRNKSQAPEYINLNQQR